MPRRATIDVIFSIDAIFRRRCFAASAGELPRRAAGPFITRDLFIESMRQTSKMQFRAMVMSHLRRSLLAARRRTLSRPLWPEEISRRPKALIVIAAIGLVPLWRYPAYDSRQISSIDAACAFFKALNINLDG